jgi:hypothetical protein
VEKSVKYKKMANLGLILTLVGLFLAAIGGYMWNKYSSKANVESHIEYMKNVDSLKDKLNNTTVVSKNHADLIIHKIENSQNIIKKMSDKEKTKPDIKVENSPNTIIQVNKNGDNVVNQKLSEPKFSLDLTANNILTDGVYITKAYFKIDHQVALKNLYLEAHNKSIISFEVVPQKSGGFMTGHSGKREGYFFSNIPGAYGTYQLIIRSTHDDTSEILYDYE